MLSPELITISILAFMGVVFIYFLSKSTYININASKPSPSLVKGFSDFIDGNKDTALQEFKNIVEDRTVSPETYLAIGLIYRSNKDYMKAVQVHEFLLGEKGIDKDFKKALAGELAKDYMLADMPLKAVTLLQKNDHLLKYPDNIITMARSQLNLQNYDQAITYHIKYHKMTGKYLHGFFAKCMIEKALHADTRHAAKYIKSALEENKLNRPARMINGMLLVRANKIPKAIIEFTKIINDGLLRDEHDFEQIEKIFIMAGKETDLLELLKKNADEGNINPFVHIALANYYIQNNEKSMAKFTMESYIELPEAKIIGAKHYANISGSKIISHIVRDALSYKCVVCGYESNDYKDDCPNCKSFDSITAK